MMPKLSVLQLFLKPVKFWKQPSMLGSLPVQIRSTFTKSPCLGPNGDPAVIMEAFLGATETETMGRIYGNRPQYTKNIISYHMYTKASALIHSKGRSSS